MDKKIEFRFKNPDDSPGYLLAHLTMLWQRKQKRVLDPLGLTHTQFVLMAALGWLSRESDNVTQVDIANQGNADRMMVSKVLRTLEQKALIARTGHKTDTRAKVIWLTDKGAVVLQQALIAVEQADAEFFSKLGDELSHFNGQIAQLLAENKNL